MYVSGLQGIQSTVIRKTVPSSGSIYHVCNTTISHLLSLTCQVAPHSSPPQATNRRTLGAMVKEMSKGGKLVWIAPSGGRDRPDPESGDWLPHRYYPGEACSTAICAPCQAYAALRIRLSASAMSSLCVQMCPVLSD